MEASGRCRRGRGIPDRERTFGKAQGVGLQQGLQLAVTGRRCFRCRGRQPSGAALEGVLLVWGSQACVPRACCHPRPSCAVRAVGGQTCSSARVSFGLMLEDCFTKFQNDFPFIAFITCRTAFLSLGPLLWGGPWPFLAGEWRLSVLTALVTVKCGPAAFAPAAPVAFLSLRFCVFHRLWKLPASLFPFSPFQSSSFISFISQRDKRQRKTGTPQGLHL